MPARRVRTSMSFRAIAASAHRSRVILGIAAAIGLPLIAGCAGLYFEPAEAPPDPAPRYNLETLPYREYWTGLVFNGHKIGFTRLQLSAVGDGTFELRSEAAMHFRFLGIDKKVTLKARDRIAGDLTLRDFEYDYDLDGTTLQVTGSRQPGALQTTVVSAGQAIDQSHPAAGKIYPASVIALYPVVHGLELGREYAYPVYDGETQSVAEVRQAVVAYERSELFDGPAFRLKTSLHGQQVDTWIDASGRPVLEMSLGGVFIAGLEDEAAARRYLTLAALNKSESLLDFSRVPTTPLIEHPRTVKRLAVEFRGFGDFEVPSAGWQRCLRSGDLIRCEVEDTGNATDDGASASHYLQSTLPVPSRAPEIRSLARSIGGNLGNDYEQSRAIVDWIQANIEQTAVDVFSALDVLKGRKAECQGNTYLYAALARSLGIPTRVVNGLVYSEAGPGFLYHTWAESLISGRWVAVDPTFGQVPADATHLKLVEGETLAELGPLTRFMGRLEARVLSVAH